MLQSQMREAAEISRIDQCLGTVAEPVQCLIFDGAEQVPHLFVLNASVFGASELASTPALAATYPAAPSPSTLGAGAGSDSDLGAAADSPRTMLEHSTIGVTIAAR